jgi:tRNA(adenine34) deaminase
MNDEFYLRQALEEARKSLRVGEVPVGAVVVSEGEMLSQAHNETISSQDPTAHAEIVAIRKACLIRNNHRLPDCDLYVTLEPCPMCLGALVQARMKRLIFGAHDPKGGAVESIMRFPFDRTNHRVDVTSGILTEECSQILEDFFRDKR